MGYCIDWKGRFDLDKPLTPEHLAALKACEDSEVYPGDPPDRRFNPWCVSKDGAGLEVLTDKPGDWKAWLQYTLDHFLTPWGYTLSGAVEWTGEDPGDKGVTTVEDGKVKARAPKSGKAWADIDVRSRAMVFGYMLESMSGGGRVVEEAWSAALCALGYMLKSDRTEFDA